MNFFGIVFIVSTTFVLIFKKEVDNSRDEGDKDHSLEDSLTVKQTYGLMWKLVWLPSIKKIILILMTAKVRSQLCSSRG